MNDYVDMGRAVIKGEKSQFVHGWKSINLPVTFQDVELGKRYRIIYEDYDYINHIFYVNAEQVLESMV